MQEAVWTGHPGNLCEWGHGRDHIYGLLATEDSTGRSLILWIWQGDSLKEKAASKLPWSTNVVAATTGICGLSLGREKGAWPYALFRLHDGQLLVEWSTPHGWWVREAGGSPNGKFVSFVATDGVDAAGYRFGHPRARVALINVETRELRWVANLDGHGAGTIRRIVITDDGRYVAVAGWNNGTAMVDANESTILWAERPRDEVSTSCAAFGPDGKTIFTAGSEGCVYAIDVATGNVLRQRWATSKGQSIYGHRVSALAVSPDGKRLAAGTGPEGEIYVWNLERDGKAQVLQHGLGTPLILAFSPDSAKLASVGAGVLKVWQLETVKQ